jgi:pilus assembly protein Flp/PilA
MRGNMEEMMKNLMKSFCQGETGGGLVEYSLILALIAVVAITLMTDIGTNIKTKLTSVKTGLG